MKELIVAIAQALVDNPDAVEVTEVEEEKGKLFELRVDPNDLGKVIGKQGRTAKAIRALLSAAALKNGTRAMLKIVE